MSLIGHGKYIQFFQTLGKSISMAESNANLPSQPDDAPRKCEKCGSSMRHLGNIPRDLSTGQTSVFRCFNCNNVVSSEK
jgi:hypothetical protein